MCQMVVQTAMFSVPQKISIYLGGDRIHQSTCSLTELFPTLYKLIDQYQISEISFAGSKTFSKKLISQFQQTTFFTERKNKIILKEI